MGKKPKYWVACSGGVDSVVLLHLLHEQKKDVGILHCNFHLRGEASNQDELFVRTLAKTLEIPIRVKEFDTQLYGEEHRINTQLAARELRYNWFEKIIQEEKGIVFLAHHFDDQMETFFLQLRRGGKVKGLSGMPVFKDGYFRPLLQYTKEELIYLAKKHHWKWREDLSNTANDYTRNWYRNEVIPWLKSVDFPLEEVVPLMHSFQKLLQFFNAISVPDVIPIKTWETLPIWLKNHILSAHQLGMFSEKEMNRLAKSEKGKFIGNHTTKVWNEGKNLVFVKGSSHLKSYQLETFECLKEDLKINAKDLFLDASKVPAQLFTRKWQHGDVFQPLGMSSEKTVGKFLRDRKVPAHQKENIYVLTNDKAQILGIFGFGVGEKFKISAQTKRVLIAKLVSVDAVLKEKE